MSITKHLPAFDFHSMEKITMEINGYRQLKLIQVLNLVVDEYMTEFPFLGKLSL